MLSIGKLTVLKDERKAGGGKKSAIECKHLFMQAHACLGTVDQPLSVSTQV